MGLKGSLRNVSTGIGIPDNAILQVDPTQSFTSGDDGATISTIPDEIGNLDLANDSGGAVLVENGINGVRSMDFDRPDEYAVSFPIVSQPTTIFIAIQFQDTNPHEVFGSNVSGSPHLFQGFVNENDRIFGGGTVSGPSSNTNPHLFTLIFDGANSVIRRDGSQVGSGDAGTNGLDGFRLGDSGEFNNNTNSLIGEVLPCNTRLSSGVIDQQESRIADKYGITLA